MIELGFSEIFNITKQSRTLGLQSGTLDFLTEEGLRVVQRALNDGVLHDRLKHAGVRIEALLGVRVDDRLLLLTIAEEIFTLEAEKTEIERPACSSSYSEILIVVESSKCFGDVLLVEAHVFQRLNGLEKSRAFDEHCSERRTRGLARKRCCRYCRKERNGPCRENNGGTFTVAAAAVAVSGFGSSSRRSG